MAKCPTCGHTLSDPPTDLLAALALRSDAKPPKRGHRPAGVRDVYLGRGGDEWFVTYGGGGPWRGDYVRSLAAKGSIVQTYPEHLGCYTLPGNQWCESAP